MARGIGSVAAAVLAALALAWPPVAQAQVDTVRAAEDALHDAIAAKDRAALLALIADDFRIGSALDRERWIVQLMGICGGGRINIRDVQTVLRGETALVSFDATTVLQAPCMPASVRSRVADVWTLADGAWRLAIRSTVALDPPPLARQHNWISSLELTVLSTQGNVDSFTFGSVGEFTWQRGRSRTNARAAFLRTTDSGEERGRSIDVQLRQTRTMTPVVELFGRGLYQRDLFAGIRHRYGVDAGLGLVLARDGHRVQATLGVGSTHEERVNFEDQSAPVATAGLQYRFAVTPTTTITEDAQATGSLTRAADWRLESTLALTTVLRQPFSLRASYASRFVNNPVPGFQRLDAILSLGLVARF